VTVGAQCLSGNVAIGFLWVGSVYWWYAVQDIRSELVSEDINLIES